jgi:hypothetical protein
MTETLKKLTLGALCAVAIGAATVAQAQTVIIGGGHHPHVAFFAGHHRHHMMYIAPHHRHHVWWHHHWLWVSDSWIHSHHGWRSHH